jgi:hypothetical protein
LHFVLLSWLESRSPRRDAKYFHPVTLKRRICQFAGWIKPRKTQGELQNYDQTSMGQSGKIEKAAMRLAAGTPPLRHGPD